jgi:hypothetical protein
MTTSDAKAETEWGGRSSGEAGWKRGTDKGVSHQPASLPAKMMDVNSEFSNGNGSTGFKP